MSRRWSWGGDFAFLPVYARPEREKTYAERPASYEYIACSNVQQRFAVLRTSKYFHAKIRKGLLDIMVENKPGFSG